MMATTATAPQHPTRSPMSSLHSQENIPLLQSPPKKSVQLGIEAFTTKRERENTEHPRIKKVKPTNDPQDSSHEHDSTQGVSPTVICHQCRQHVHPHLSVRCTRLKNAGGMKNPGTKRCVSTYCQRCVANRYNERLVDIFEDQHPAEGDHDPEAGYVWSCPACRGICNCSVCRKRKGLAPLG
jgi:hypothetical protein